MADRLRVRFDDPSLRRRQGSKELGGERGSEQDPEGPWGRGGNTRVLCEHIDELGRGSG